MKAPAGHALQLIGIGVLLLVLTTLSFALSRLHLGVASVPVAMGIALVKSVLIALFFMHLLEQRKSNALVFGTAVFFVGLLLTLTLLETATRFGPSVPPGPFVARAEP